MTTPVPRPLVPTAARTTAVALVLAVFVAPARAQCVEDCTAIHTLVGEASGDQFGWVSNDLGDLDGDGVHDFVITAPTNDAAGANAGRIYVHSGATGALLWRWTGPLAGGWLGHDAGAAGDVNGDGIRDVIVGAPFNGTGRAYVLSGAGAAEPLFVFTGTTAGEQFGARVAGDADYDGDGIPDLVIGSPEHDAGGTNAGQVTIRSGADGSIIDVIDGLAAGDRLGSGVAFAGDLDGDGRSEVMAGAKDAGVLNRGEVLVLGWNGSDSRLVHRLAPGQNALDYGLWFMNGGLDVDGDGVPDMYVNDYQRDQAFVHSGADGSIIHVIQMAGAVQFGIGRLVPDVDGDGLADLILCDWISNEGAPGAGQAFIHSGADGRVLDTYTHDVANSGFGFDANGMGDVDGDGAADWLVTAASWSSSRGRIFVIAGEIHPAPGPDPDLDGDGVVSFSDLLSMLSAWGDCPAPPAACPADLDRNGVVGFEDLLPLLAAWD